MWKAVEAVLEENDFKLERRRRDECGGRITARREGGPRVVVTIHASERSRAEIALYVEPADRAQADLLQAKIEEKLGLKRAHADLFGETSVESSYEADLALGTAAAKRACAALELELTQVQVDSSRARIEGRDSQSRHVRFKMRLTEGRSDEIEVILSTDSTAAGDEKEFLRKVRREFERHLFPAGE